MTERNSLENHPELRARVLETLGRLPDESLHGQSASRNELIEAIMDETGCTLEETEELLREMGVGLRDDGIQGHSPASGSTGLDQA